MDCKYNLMSIHYISNFKLKLFIYFQGKYFNYNYFVGYYNKYKHILCNPSHNHKLHLQFDFINWSYNI